MQINTLREKDIHDYIDIYADPIIIILTFILGYVLSTKISNRQEALKLDRILDYFNIYWINQKKGIKKQVDYINEEIERTSNITKFNFLPITIVSQPFSILETMNKESLFAAWTRKNKAEDFIEILKHIEFCKNCFLSYRESYNKFSLKHVELIKKWNEQLQICHDIKINILRAPMVELVKNPQVVKLNDIYNDWANNDNKELRTTIEKFTKPIIEYFTPIYEQNPNNNIAALLLKNAQKTEMIYEEISYNFKAYHDYIKDLYISINIEIKKVEHIMHNP